jgi:hypothetical protein
MYAIFESASTATASCFMRPMSTMVFAVVAAASGRTSKM